MYVNEIDILFDDILNDFNDYLTKSKTFNKLSSDTNFVKFQNDILITIKTFIDKINKKNIIEIVKHQDAVDIILNIIKRYCAFYVYLGIGYYYEGGRDLYITNIIESGKYQKDATIQIQNFFNSDSNSKIINFYNDIKNFLSLLQYKTIDKIKILLMNNPLKYESTIRLFNDLGEDYITEYFLVKDNFHNIIKTIIIKQIYLKEDKNDMIKLLNQETNKDAEYKYIEIIVSNEKKLVDFNFIQKFLTMQQLKAGMAEDIYKYLEDFKSSKQIVIREQQDFINYLFNNEIIIPITEDFLRYHKNTEKYLSESGDTKDRDATKIKYIINKMNNVINYYSPILDKNPKLKLDIQNLFYKPLDPRMAILYNDNEELKIIQKLENVTSDANEDLVIELENLRKYAYVNFKNFSRDGIKVRTPKTITSIRQTSIKQNPKDKIETRISHDSNDINIVGIAWNPSKSPLITFSTEDLEDVRKITKRDNGYSAFIKVMNKSFSEAKDNKLYYWLFDNKKDIPKKTEGYINYNVNDVQKNIKIMIEEVYNNYIDLLKAKANNFIESMDELNTWQLEKVLYHYNFLPDIKNELIEKVYSNKIKEEDIIIDYIDNLMPIKKKALIELPILKIEKEKIKKIIIGEKEIDVSLELSKRTIPVCNHYIKWKNIGLMSKNTDIFNQAVFDFVKQYIKTNQVGDYICKSCNEYVPLHKYVFEGTYVEELDTFLTTSLVVTQKLEDNPKYAKYTRSIRNIEKNIEKFANAMNLIFYVGNTPVIKLRRKTMIKDIIDLILLHTEWLRNQPKDRIENAANKYGFNKVLTNLFFFELKDDIFLTSSTETDYYKIIKYNNIMAYLLLIMIMEMNSGQILSLKEDKRYNYFLYDKAAKVMFDNILLRRSQKEVVPINKVPLLCYILYYFSGIMVSNRFWLYNDSDVAIKEKPLFMASLQKTIIVTVIDLINSLVEANFEENKNFLYEIITSRFDFKLRNVFNDSKLLERIEIQSNKNIKYDQTTNTVKILTKKIDLIELSSEYDIVEKQKERCDLKIIEIKYKLESPTNNNIDILTVCPDGKFHNWEFKNNDLICKNCNKSYNELSKIVSVSSEKPDYSYLDRIKIINLKKLFKKYCLSGSLHDLNQAGECSLCKLNINTYNPSEKDLKILERNIEAKTNEVIIQQINQMRDYANKLSKIEVKSKKIINKLLKKYEKDTQNRLELYINNFVNKLSDILGSKIKIDNKTIYLKDTLYIIDHDYLGNDLKDPFNVASSENKIIIESHSSFNKEILYYQDKANKVYVYYDPITLQYLGYSDNNRDIKKTKKNASIKIDLSLKDNIMLMGYENKYYNIYHLDKEYQKRMPTEEETIDIILKIIRDRMSNLRQVISRMQSLIYNIRNSGSISTIYNLEEKKIVNEFIKKIKDFKTSDNKKSVFKNHDYILSRLSLNENIPNLKLSYNNNYLDISILNTLNNSDMKLIYYIVSNLNRLLDYNDQTFIKSELALLIIKIIKYLFNLYYRPYSNSDIRKFDFLLINETPYIDERYKVAGHYQELLTQEEIDVAYEKNNDAKEEFNAFDVDDYEVDDDIDGAAEAFDGYEP